MVENAQRREHQLRVIVNGTLFDRVVRKNGKAKN